MIECPENCDCGGCEHQREILISNQHHRQLEEMRKEYQGEDEGDGT